MRQHSSGVKLEVAQVAEQGGTVLEDVRSIDPFGTMATILDSEGNRVELHSNTDA